MGGSSGFLSLSPPASGRLWMKEARPTAPPAQRESRRHKGRRPAAVALALSVGPSGKPTPLWPRFLHVWRFSLVTPVLPSDRAFLSDSPNPKSFCTQGSCPLRGSGTAGPRWARLCRPAPCHAQPQGPRIRELRLPPGWPWPYNLPDASSLTPAVLPSPVPILRHSARRRPPRVLENRLNQLRYRFRALPLGASRGASK